MKIKKVLQFISERNGKIFCVKFTKRTTGEERVMTCRQGVTAHLVKEPKRKAVDFDLNGIIPVFDMIKGAYRSIPIEGIVAIKVDGDWEPVTHGVKA